MLIQSRVLTQRWRSMAPKTEALGIMANATSFGLWFYLTPHSGAIDTALMPIFFFCLVSLIAPFPIYADSSWPQKMTDFNYTADNLSEHWQTLTGGFRGPLPSGSWIETSAAQWPMLEAATRMHLVTLADSHPYIAEGLEADEKEQYGRYAHQLRETWALIFNGQLERASELGVSLGAGGYYPALYAQALRATLTEQAPAQRRALLEEIAHRTDELLNIAPDHPTIRFGNAYAKARILETLSVTEALSSGYTSEVLSTLDKLLSENPNHIYAMTLYGGVHAGIVDKAGKLMAKLSYGATPASVQEKFERALSLDPDSAAIRFEYAKALLKVGDRSGRKVAKAHLEKTANLVPASGEQALYVDAAIRALASFKD